MDSNYPFEVLLANPIFLENVYQHYLKNPTQLDNTWRQFFQGLEAKQITSILQSLEEKLSSGERIAYLIEAYRRYGHLLATVNPLTADSTVEPTRLKLEQLGFQLEEQDKLFPTLGFLPQAQAPLHAIIDALKKCYCGGVGYEFKDLVDPAIEQWIQQQIESGEFNQPFSPEEKRSILDLLSQAELMESFLHTKHVGKKRFSLEGAETLIPMLALLIDQAAQEGVQEMFIGMSHRGRINVLANILHKPIPDILKDFDEDYEPGPLEGMGDIRYHKGHTNEAVKTYQNHSIKLTLAPNPSHLESVNPVIQGKTHAKQFLVGDESERRKIMPLLMHGDASLAGQGVVYETLQLTKLEGYETGGTVHIVINNQIGFTTSPEEARSTRYCTDIAHTFGFPVFHINAENPENCVRIALLALSIRQRFHCDVFIDLMCYRKYGHNEGDEPAFTQPLDYQIIRKKKSIREFYRDQLSQEGIIEEKVVEEREEQIKKHWQEVYDQSQTTKKEPLSSPIKNFSPFETISTGVDLDLLKTLADRLSQIPSDFHMHPKLEHLVKERGQVVQQDKPLDWGTAESLAYATLLWEGIPVRISGQDSGRGTFSHRHALWVDQKNNLDYYPLAHLGEGQGRFEVLNSCLSEAAVLGFEYGYSVICAEGLTIWEAQFGDFANSAQVAIDQYIASGEQKWGQTSRLVLFLPHGFEGQGPEHSSARLERFLMLAGHENMQVVNPTTPGQLFHLLRRQVKQPEQKPLIVMTPKGLLRHQACVSPLKDLVQGQFKTILDDPRQPQKVRRVVLCSGRIYYELDAQRIKEERQDIAIIRIEQLYPLDEQKLKNLLGNYKQLKDCLWVQEEPENMGAWLFISSYLSQILPSDIPFSYVGRERSATPATGFYTRHRQEHDYILHQVFQT